MKRGERPHGYTIIEVMIVLAVTGLMFATAFFMFQGRQAKTQFTQATRDIETIVRDTINQVTNGYYPSDNFNCTISSGRPQFTASATSSQGDRVNCIFLGKVMHFGVQQSGLCDGATKQACDNFNVYSLAGRRTTSGREVTNLNEANPKAIIPEGTSTKDLTESSTLHYGLHVTGMWYITDTATPIAGVGFISPFGSYSGTSLQNTQQQVNIIPLTGSSLGQDKATAASQILNYGLDETLANPKNGILICMKSPDDKLKSGIWIGANNSQATVEALFAETLTARSSPYVGAACS